MSVDCIFCDRSKIKSKVVLFNNNVFMFEPLNPVVDGHVLFVPKVHVKDASDNPLITAKVFKVASWYAKSKEQPFNLITSAGGEATQSVYHLHVHYVPRKENDGLQLPWTGQAPPNNLKDKEE